MKPENVWMSWSTGKDSCYCLYELLKDPRYVVTGLVTTINESFGRVAMHAVRDSLLEKQATALNLPLHPVLIPNNCSNETYERKMRLCVENAKAQGVSHIAFGDLFLEDVRAYREKMLAGAGIKALFPLWEKPTRELALSMIGLGFKSIVTCVDPRKLDPSFAGRSFDECFLADLPSDVDPCGENGEFHTFCHDGPPLRSPIHVELGQVIVRDGFVFADIVEPQ